MVISYEMYETRWKPHVQEHLSFFPPRSLAIGQLNEVDRILKLRLAYNNTTLHTNHEYVHARQKPY